MIAIVDERGRYVTHPFYGFGSKQDAKEFKGSLEASVTKSALETLYGTRKKFTIVEVN